MTGIITTRGTAGTPATTATGGAAFSGGVAAVGTIETATTAGTAGARARRLRLDPRTKLFLLLEANLLLFCHVDTRTEALLTGFFLLLLFLSGRIRAGVRFALIYAVLLALSLIEPPTHGTGAWLAIFPMLAVGIRMLLPCLITGAFAFTTTTPGEFTAALRRMRIPEAVIIPCIVVIRFFPTLCEDYRHIRNAMALRGIPSGGGSLLRHPAQSLEYIIVPLLMNATTVAQDLSVAALTKGLGNPGRHTSMTDIRIGLLDWAVMALCALPLILFLAGSL
ncbi:energy-coupling factor transporter transmembrane component T [Bifidobacterium pullorum]|uniref:energy-coupling factor transporter transmembrane component T n=1 Tax=Bifidobacterium pullorum TaxID=78448 RepID=UPI00242BF9FA|nr:energy-coupling factor transporter transmembrane component T [Bifidobacterium pullorum]